MGIGLALMKYKKQFQAALPKYDTVYDVKTDEPIRFFDSDNIRLSMAIIADTHLPNRESAEKNLGNTFKDLSNSPESFDAFLMAGDIVDYGTNKEYERFFRALDRQNVTKNIFVTMGNHDARLFYNKNKKIILKKTAEYLKDNSKKIYYSHDVKGYTIIVLCTEKRVMEKAYISKEQIAFLDRELKRGTKDNKPVFVMCHQPFGFTHGLPEVWRTGDMGKQNDEVRAVMEKYKNVFFLNGHLHGGIFDKTAETLNEENGVYSISIPGYRKPNNFGIQDCGVGYICEVYDNEVIFTARKFITGESIKGDYTVLKYKLK